MTCYDWTNPSRADLARQAAAEAEAEHDLDEAEKLRKILEDAAVAVGKLEFRLGFPTPSYDVDHVVSILRDMHPPAEKVLYSELLQRALDEAESR